MKIFRFKLMFFILILCKIVALQSAAKALPVRQSEQKIELNDSEKTEYRNIYAKLLKKQNQSWSDLEETEFHEMLMKASSRVFTFKRAMDQKVLFQIAIGLTEELSVLAFIASLTNAEYIQAEYIQNKNRIEALVLWALKGDGVILLNLIDKIGVLSVLSVGLTYHSDNRQILHSLENYLNTLSYNLSNSSIAGCAKNIIELIILLRHVVFALQKFQATTLFDALSKVKIVLKNLLECPSMIIYSDVLNFKFLTEGIWIETYPEKVSLLGFIIINSSFFQSVTNPSKFQEIAACFQVLKRLDFNFSISIQKDVFFIYNMILASYETLEQRKQWIDFIFDDLKVNVNHLYDSKAGKVSLLLLTCMFSTSNIETQQFLITSLLDKGADLNEEMLTKHIVCCFSEKRFAYVAASPFLKIFETCSYSFFKYIVDNYQNDNFDYSQKIKKELMNECCFYGLVANLLQSLNVRKNHDDSFNDLSQKIKFLQEKGVDINYYDGKCNTALSSVISQFNDKMVQFLLENGVQIQNSHNDLFKLMQRKFEEMGKSTLTDLEMEKYNMSDPTLKNYKGPRGRFERFENIEKLMNLHSLKASKKVAPERLQKTKEKVLEEPVDTQKEIISPEAFARKRMVEEQKKTLDQLINKKNIDYVSIQKKDQNKEPLNSEACMPDLVPKLSKKTMPMPARALPAKESGIRNFGLLSPFELLKQKKYNDMDTTEQHRVNNYLKQLSENFGISFDLNLYNKYGILKSVFGLLNVVMDFSHIFSLNVAIDRGEISFKGGHLYDACNKLSALSIVDCTKTTKKTMPNGCVHWSFKPVALGAAPVFKTTFPESWTIEEICKQIAKSKLVKSDVSEDGWVVIYAQTDTSPTIDLKMVFQQASGSYPNKLLTVMPVDQLLATPFVPSPVKAKALQKGK